MPLALLATCTELPDGDEDAGALTAALEAHGVSARWAVWDDPAVDWSAGVVVLRSTWDYAARRTEFLRWLNALPRVENPAEIVAWSTDKTYLRDVAEAGVPVVDTVFAEPGEATKFPAVEFVVKPSVGAGSRGVGRFAPGDHDVARAHLDDLHRDGVTALVQPYLDAVDTAGETALIYLDGRFSHAIRKGPMLGAGVRHPTFAERELFVAEQITARVPDPAELAVGDAALAAVRARFGVTPLYARVDLLPSASGPRVVEFELAEPSLFLGHAAGGADPASTFATALASRLAPTGTPSAGTASA